jgi:hypothetical protein
MGLTCCRQQKQVISPGHEKYKAIKTAEKKKAEGG